MKPDKSSLQSLKFLVVIALIFTLFITWGGDNSWSRYDLTASMVEHRSLEISNYSYNTHDKLLYPYERIWKEINRSRYNKTGQTLDTVDRDAVVKLFERDDVRIYSGKAPFSSVIAVPGYLLGDMVSGQSQKDLWYEDGLSDDFVQLSHGTSIKQFFIVLTTSSLFGAALVFLVYSGIKEQMEENTAFYTSLLLALATPIFFYSSTYFGVINAAFFGFLSYILMKKSLDSRSQVLMAAAGISAGLAVSTEYYALIIPFMVSIYLSADLRLKSIFNYTSGVLIGALPLFVYNYLIKKDPFTPLIVSRNFFSPGTIGTTCSFYEACFSGVSYPVIFGSILDPVRTINLAFRLLFMPSRGIFFYAPVLLLVIPGTYFLYKKNKFLTLLFPGVFFVLILFQATRLNWLAGASFGPRYAVLGLPFLGLPLAYGIKHMLDGGLTKNLLLVLLVLFSFFNTVIAFGGGLGPVDITAEEYAERMGSMQTLDKDFYPRLVDNFNTYGGRSELLMSFSNRSKGFDITYRAPYGKQYLELLELRQTSVLLSTNYIPLAILGFLVSVLLYSRSDLLFRSVIALSLVLLLSSITFSSSFIESETFRGETDQGAVDGRMDIVFYSRGGTSPELELVKNAPRKQLDIRLKVNGEKTFETNLRTNRSLTVTGLSNGRNEISIESECVVPALLSSNYSNPRCISYSLVDIDSINSSSFEEPVLMDEDGKNITGTGLITSEASVIFRKSAEDRLVRLKLDRDLKLPEDSFSIGGEEARSYYMRSNRSYLVELPGDSKGLQRLKIDYRGCGNRSETAPPCEGFRVENISVIDRQEIPELIYTQGWYQQEKDGRWMGREAEILVSMENRDELLNLRMDPYHRMESQKLLVESGAGFRRNISLQDQREFAITLQSDAMFSTVSLKSSGGCKVPAVVENDSEDHRCISMFLENISRTGLEIPGNSYSLERGWYSEEGEEQDSYRWISNRSLVLINNSEDRLLGFNAQKYWRLESSLDIFRDQARIAEFNSSSFSTRLFFEGNERKKVLRLESSEGCRVPSRVENSSSDDRCLSYRIGDLVFDRLIYENGWYSEEGSDRFSYRWMKDQGNISFASSSNQSILTVEAKPYVSIEDPVLEVNVNGEYVGEIRFGKKGRFRKKITIPSGKDINQLSFKSSRGCRVPAEEEPFSRDLRCLSFQFNEVSIE